MYFNLITYITLVVNIIIIFNYSKFNFLFIILLTSFTIINFIITFLNDEKKKIYLISLISSIIAIYIFEIYSQNLFKYLKNQNSFSKIEIVNYDEATGKKFYIAPMAPVKFKKLEKNTLMPLSGLRNVNNYLCVESEGKIFYQSDEYGFNNKYGDHEKEIFGVVVGDSFVQGECVPHNNNLTMKLQYNFNKKFMNLGLRGSGQLTQYAILKEYGESLKPKIVILLIFIDNDIEDFYEEIDFNPIYKNYLNNINFSQKLRLKAKKVEKQYLKNLEDEYLANIKSRHSQSALNRIISVLKMSQTRSLFKIKVFKENKNFEKEFLNTTSKKYKKNIQNFKQLTDTWGGKLICAPFHGAKILNFQKYSQFFYNQINNILENNGCDKVVPFPSKYQNNLKSWAYTFGGGHLSSYGYEKMAKNIYLKLKQND